MKKNGFMGNRPCRLLGLLALATVIGEALGGFRGSLLGSTREAAGRGEGRPPAAGRGSTAVMWACYGITAISIIVRIIMYCKVHSLYIDEAFLVESIVTRTFGSLVATPLVNDQTAPVLYLYVVKLFGALTGYSEGGLRVFSLLMFLGMIAVEYLLLTRVFKVGKVWTAFAICVTATLGIYMRYSNELKPYMGDAFFVTAILLLYHLYRSRKIKLPVLTAACCLVLLFSSPALFFIASVFICEFVFAIIEKDKGRIIKTVCAGVIVLAFFLAYYVWWLMPVAESDLMINFWEKSYFSIWPLNSSVLKQDIGLVYNTLGKRGCIYFVFAFAGLIVSLIRKDKISFVTGCSIVLLFAASCVRKYPMSSRLWLFIFVLEILYMAVCFDSVKAILLTSECLPLKGVFAFIAVILVVYNLNFITFAGNGLYFAHLEANPLIAYLQKNIGDDEYAYIYPTARYIVKYKNGFDTNRIGNVERDNIIWGGGDVQVGIEGKIIWHWDAARAEWGEFNQSGAVNEIHKIVAAEKAYLLFYDFANSPALMGIETGLKKLATLGYLHKVGEFHKTPLYYFTTDPNDPKRSETHDFGN